MIAKRVKRETGSNFKRLAKYIAVAEEDGEKLDDFWIVNSIAGESLNDLDLAIIDIGITQNKNIRTTQDKTYHLIVSFRNDKPDIKALKDIECEFAKALGFEEHQRVVGTHQNTDNFHMHIAYNKVNPKTYNIKTPFQEFKKLSKVCRAMEQKYNLSVDNGFEKTKEPDYEKPHIKARDFEAKTWQQSFYSYVKEQKEPLTKALDKSQKWQDLHNAFAEVGLLLKKRGNGLAIVSKDEKMAIKASDLDRSFSKNSLEKKLGKFEESKNEVEPKITYVEKPLTKHPNTEILWQKYQEVKKKPKEKAKEQSLLKKAFYTWKDFLMAEATKDPFAMAVIVAQKKIIKSIMPSFDKTSKTTIEPEPQEKERYIVEIPKDCPNQKEIKKLTKFDDDKEVYFLEKDRSLNIKTELLQNLGGVVLTPEIMAEREKEAEIKNDTIEKMLSELKSELKKDDATYQAIKESLKTDNDFFEKMYESYKKHTEEKELALKKSKSYGYGMGM